MVSKNFFEALELIAVERGLNIDDIMSKVKFSMEKAARDAGFTGEIKLEVDNEKKEIKVFDVKYIVDELTNTESIEDQKKKPKLKIEGNMKYLWKMQRL